MPVVAGTCVYSVVTHERSIEHTWQWTSDVNGDVRQNMETSIAGLVWRLITQPIDTPTANYDITIVDHMGADVLLGKGVDRSNTAAETSFVYDSTNPEVRSVTHGRHQFVIANAGATKSGIAILSVLPDSA